MIEIISAFGRESVIVHNADKGIDVCKEVVESLQAAGLKACKPGDRILVLAEFTHRPNATVALLECPVDMDIKKTLRVMRDSLDFMNESDLELEKKRNELLRLIDENL